MISKYTSVIMYAVAIGLIILILHQLYDRYHSKLIFYRRTNDSSNNVQKLKNVNTKDSKFSTYTISPTLNTTNFIEKVNLSGSNNRIILSQPNQKKGSNSNNNNINNKISSGSSSSSNGRSKKKQSFVNARMIQPKTLQSSNNYNHNQLILPNTTYLSQTIVSDPMKSPRYSWKGYAQCRSRKYTQIAHIRTIAVPSPSYFANPIYYQLRCESHNYSIGNIPTNLIFADMKLHQLPRKCPIIYDYRGESHTSPHMCVASKQEKVCIFTLPNTIVTVCGGLVDHKTRIAYNYFHHSMGMLEPVYYHSVHVKWMTYFQDNLYLDHIPQTLDTYDYVIPIRMLWDDNFGHLYHQSIPFIAHVYEFLPSEMLPKVYWHCSVYTAAILELLEIPKERLLVQSMFQKQAKQQPILAKQVILPWVSGFCPPQTPTLHGVANRILKTISTNLIKMFEGQEKSLNKLRGNNDRSNNKDKDRNGSGDKKRTILYLARVKGQTRNVVNQDVIIDLLYTHINHKKYELIVVNRTEEHKSIPKLHQAWYKHAIYFSKARVVIGPHGSAFGNLMWSPDDTDYIEFNVFPDDPRHTNPSSKSLMRPSLISAVWAKGGTSKIFMIDPCQKNLEKFYDSDIKVSPYEILQTLVLLGDGIIAEDMKNSSLYKPEKHYYVNSNTMTQDNTAIRVGNTLIHTF